MFRAIKVCTCSYYISLILIVCVLFLCEVSSTSCDYYSPCSCVFDDGKGMMDLNSLYKSDGSPLFYDQASVLDNYLYSYNPCGAFTEGTCVNVAACQYDPYYYIFYDIGVPDKVKFEMEGSDVVATYSSADGSRKTFVKFVCNPDVSVPSIAVDGEITTTNYHMTITGSVVCPVAAPAGYYSNGLSAGSVLLIIFFVLLVVYVIAGVAYGKFRQQKQGKELIPNLPFWTDLPGLVKDGCVYFIGRLKQLRQGYQPMK